MKNELVKETKDLCRKEHELLVAKHTELRNGGATVSVLNELSRDIKEVVDIFTEVNPSNVIELNNRAKELKRALDEKYSIEEIVPELEETEEGVPELEGEDPELEGEDPESEESEEEESEEEISDDKRNNCVAGILLGAAGVAALGGIAVHTGVMAKKAKNCASIDKVEEVAVTEEPVKVIDNNTNDEVPADEKKEEEVPENQLVLGEYGTFFDVNDNEQVEARAKYIFDNYFANNESLTEQQKQLITVENIANTIRIMNGVLPIDENGYQFFNGTALNDYTNILTEAVVNIPSNDNDHYTYFPAYLLTVDGSEESDFIKSYSEIYDKLIYSLNEHDDEQVQDAIACLGFKFYNEWYLQGMHGDINPHLFNTELKFLTFISTIEPYNTTAREWHISEKKPVCIYVCPDYENRETMLVSVNDIQTALETGEWNDVGAKLGDMDVEPVQWLAEYYKALNDALSWKYDHREVKTLK